MNYLNYGTAPQDQDRSETPSKFESIEFKVQGDAELESGRSIDIVDFQLSQYCTQYRKAQDRPDFQKKHVWTPRATRNSPIQIVRGLACRATLFLARFYT